MAHTHISMILTSPLVLQGLVQVNEQQHTERQEQDEEGHRKHDLDDVISERKLLGCAHLVTGCHEIRTPLAAYFVQDYNFWDDTF